MTREAKIGMLTGLGVIVLIGVLLSEYLGDNKGIVPAALASTSSTGHMAPLQVGQNYRQQIMAPISVPGLTQGNAPLTGGAEQTVAVPGTTTVPPAYAAEAQPVPQSQIVTAVASGPMVNEPASPVALGPAPVETQSVVANPPTIMLEPLRPETSTPADAPAAKPATITVTYTIAVGDNLAKIARKFYNSSKQSDVNRIVAANPGVLKDSSTMLVAGKKLNIPNVPAPAVKPTIVPAKGSPMLANSPEKVFLPGGDGKTSTKQDITVKISAPVKKPAPRTYVVQSGDTLEKIAKRLAPSSSKEMIEKLKTANGIKDPHGLQVGTSLKIPV
jgi:LysM repeat protein